MFKLILSGIWVAAVALVAVYFSVQMALAPKVDNAEAERRANEETIRSELTSLPIFEDGHVKGYFLTKLSYVVDKVKMASIHIPIDVLITDELFTTLVGNKMINVNDAQSFDVDAYRKLIRESLNKRLGEDVVHDVLIEQIDYLSKGDLRSNIAQKNLNIKGGAPIVKGDVNEDGTANAGHAPPAH